MQTASIMTTMDWSELYGQLHAYVASRLRGAPETDDVVQRIMERAIEKSADTEIDNAPAWLFGIARNAIADHYRAQARALAVQADLVEQEAPLGDSDQERAAVLACMEPLLQTLPAESAQLLAWADMQERSMQAIADQLGITLTAAKSRVQRARKEFVKATRQCCAIAVDARGRVTALTPKRHAPCAAACPPSNDCAALERKPS